VKAVRAVTALYVLLIGTVSQYVCWLNQKLYIVGGKGIIKGKGIITSPY